MNNNIFTIYRNYGVLGREKRNVYTYGGEESTATYSDEITVRLPENNTFSLYKNEIGKLMVESAWGWSYDINDVLQGNDMPCFFAKDKDMIGHRVYLELVD